MKDVAADFLREIEQQNLPDVIGAVERWVRGDEATWRYARCLEEWGSEFEMYRKSWSRNVHDLSYRAARTVGLIEMRRHYIGRFGFMLPCAELLDALQEADLVVEVGAGTGFMTRIMRHRRIRVIGSDPQLGYGYRNQNQWFNTSVFSLPALGYIGNSARDVYRGPGQNQWDLAAFKNFTIHERGAIQLRGEFYNAFNHTQWSSIDTTARFDATGKQINGTFGQATGDRGGRVVQLALRVSF